MRVQTGRFSLTSGMGILSLCFGRTQLLPLTLSLECLGENKALVLLCLTNTSCPVPGPIYFLPRLNRSLLASAGGFRSLPHGPFHPGSLLPQRRQAEHFPGGSVDKNPPAKAGDTGLIPRPGRFHMLRAN